MNRFYAFLTAAFCTYAVSTNAQRVFTFENLQVLPDSFISPKNLAGGFGDSLVFFQSKWDTSFGGYWSHGFAPSTKKDKVTPGFGNQYSAITGSGYNSNTYAISYGESGIKLKGKAAGKVVNGFYITNTTYAYFSMRDGDAFSKKFGGSSGNDPDFFYLTVKGYLNAVPKKDSVNFYLADFRFADNNKDYILSEWAWVNLATLGNVDSLSFQLHSSDVGQFGMNTPAYFAMDNFTFNDGVSEVENTLLHRAKMYPNPLAIGTHLHFELPESSHLIIRIISVSGEVVKEERAAESNRITLETSSLAPGMYFAQIFANGAETTFKFGIR